MREVNVPVGQKIGQENGEARQGVVEILGELGIGDGKLDALLREFMSNGARGFRRDALAIASDLINKNDPQGALLSLLNGSNLPVGARYRIRTLEKMLAAMIGPDASGVVMVGFPSDAFPLGMASHTIEEWMYLAGGNLNGLEKRGVRLINDGSGYAKEVEFSEKTTEPENYQPLLDPVFEINTDRPVCHPRRIRLEEPLPLPEEGQGDTDWARMIFSNSLETIERSHGKLPSRPYDIAEILKNEESRKALLQLVEAAHIIFGLKPGMNAVVNNEHDGEEIICAEGISEFAALDLLALARSCLDLEYREEHSNSSEVMLTEMPLGALRTGSVNEESGRSQEFALWQEGKTPGETFDVRGGIVDLMRIKLTPLAGGKREYSLRQFAEYAERECQSQAKRHRRKEIGLDGRTREKRTMLGKNFKAYLQLLWGEYGDRIFTDLEISAEDFKFPAGDGGWFTVFDARSLPLKGHEQQIAEYLFTIIAQLCWVFKWSRGWSEDFCLTVKDVVDFARQYAVYPRVKGLLRYQLPSGEEQRLVTLSGEEDLEKLGNHLFGKRQETKRKQIRSTVLRTLLVIVGKGDNLTFERKKLPLLPEFLEGICFDLVGKRFLVTGCLADRLFGERSEEREVVVNKAILFDDEKVFVLWVDGLASDRTLRVAVNGNSGKFAITGLEEMITGDLSTTRQMVGVQERSEDIKLFFLQQIWERLSDLEVKRIQVDSAVSSERVVLPNGDFYPTIPDKPIICRQNVMRGEWVLDLGLLEEAVAGFHDTGDDIYGLGALAELIARGRRRQENIFCPLPNHDNRKTEAATVYPEGSIYCGACQTLIEIPRKGITVTTVPMKEGLEPGDFQPVSRGRNQVFGELFNLARILEFYTGVANRYITEVRGLDPEGDLGKFGFIPLEVSKALDDLVESEVFREASRSLRVDHLGSHEVVDRFLESIGIVSVADQTKVLEILKVGALREMKMRGIIGASKVGEHRLGGRLLLPTRWLEEIGENDYQFATANFIGRGIVIDGQSIYQGSKQHKAYVRQRGKVTEGRRLRSTPAGFWIRDPDSFLRDQSETVFVFEGPLSAASFCRIRQEYKQSVIANLGTGFRELIALLHWLGVEGDKDWQDRLVGRKVRINTVCLAGDFDKGGTGFFLRTKKHLESTFRGLEIVPVHNFLPPEIKDVVPPYEPSLFESGGLLENEKLDMNDLILGPFRKYAFRGR